MSDKLPTPGEILGAAQAVANQAVGNLAMVPAQLLDLPVLIARAEATLTQAERILALVEPLLDKIDEVSRRLDEASKPIEGLRAALPDIDLLGTKKPRK